MMTEIREAIEKGEYKEYKKRKLEGMLEFDSETIADGYNIARNWRKG
jgi:queuine tRNA-ribosyltransferase